jgi:NAD(P)-dependent dehydrogenase (short-subunit alcohol dehydrogenase family)
MAAGSAQRERRVAVVTGGSAGVGRASVRELAARGWDVAVLARGRAGLEGAVRDVAERGRRGLAVPADVADADAVRAAAERTERELGEIGVWVNAAFAGSLAFSWDTPMEEYRRITDVTYLGQVHGTLTALELMRPRDRGVIVNVGSAMAFRSIPLQAAYCGAKHAVKGFSESVATELRHEKSGVRLSQVQLPGLNTTQFNWNASRMPRHPMPVPPVFQPEVAARAIARMAERPRRNLWVGVSTAYTILGERLAPGLVSRYLAHAGVAGQQTDADPPRWGSNLFEARDEEQDRGAHGPFDASATHRDPVLWISGHRGPLAAGTAAVALGAAGALLRRAAR